jgi:polyphosphate glucokinase
MSKSETNPKSKGRKPTLQILVAFFFSFGFRDCFGFRISSFGSIFPTSQRIHCNAVGGVLMQILVLDIGGNHVKMLLTGQEAAREFPSGPSMTAQGMVAGVLKVADGWKFEVISIGYPGPVLRGKPVAEPHNLGAGWVGFDYAAAFGCPVKLINDAAMQALGGYDGGKMLFLGLGTGLGSAMIVDGIVEPMELGHLPYRKKTYEDYVGMRGLKRLGPKKWRRCVEDVVASLSAALQPDYVVLGGGNVHKLKEMPPNCRMGDNANAFRGGFRLWEDTETKSHAASASAPKPQPKLN